MKILGKSKWMLAGFMLLLVGSFVVSGCASTCYTCSSPAKPAAVKKACSSVTSDGNMLRGTMTDPTRDKSSSILFVEKKMPAEVRVGVPFDYQIILTNLADFNVEDVVVTEKVSDKFKVISATPEPTSSTGNVVKWNLGGLKCGEQVVINVKGQMDAAGELPNCTSVDYKQSLCMSAVAISPALKVNLDAPKEVMLCESIPVKIVVTNTGTGTVRDVQLNYALPEGLVTSDGQKAVASSIGTLRDGESKSVTVNLKAQKAGRFSNVAKAVAADGLTASSASVATVVKQPALKVSQSGPSMIYAGRNADYKITVSNTGDTVAQNTVLQGQLPSGCSFVKASDNGSASGSGVNWNLGNLNAGDSKSVSMTCKATAKAAMQSSAVAQAYCCEAATAKASTNVQGISAILLEVIDVNDPIEVGGDEQFVITVTNQGSEPDTNIVVDVEMGEFFKYGASSGATKAASESSTAVKFAPLPSLGAGEKATWQVVGKATGEGQNLIGVELSSDQLKKAVSETEATTIY